MGMVPMQERPHLRPDVVYSHVVNIQVAVSAGVEAQPPAWLLDIRAGGHFHSFCYCCLD